MKLSAFLESATQCGCSRLRVQSPRGYELLRGTLGQLSAEDVEARIAADARPLNANVQHEYPLVVEDESGQRSDRFTVRVHGGEHPREEGGHFVEPSQANSSNAALGHMVKLAVSLAGTVQELAKRIADGDTEAVKELRKTQRAAMKNGEAEVQLAIVKAHVEREKAGSSNTRELLGEVLGFGKMALARVSPGVAGAELAEFQDSLTDEQLDELGKLLGESTLRRLLAASTPARFCDVADGIEPAKFQGIEPLLNEKQKKSIQAAIAAEFMRRAKAREDADKAKSAANGAAS